MRLHRPPDALADRRWPRALGEAVESRCSSLKVRPCWRHACLASRRKPEALRVARPLRTAVLTVGETAALTLRSVRTEGGRRKCRSNLRAACVKAAAPSQGVERSESLDADEHRR